MRHAEYLLCPKNMHRLPLYALCLALPVLTCCSQSTVPLSARTDPSNPAQNAVLVSPSPEVTNASKNATIAPGIPKLSASVAESNRYTVEHAETVTGVARHFLAHTHFMTVAELDSAIRAENGLAAKQLWLKPRTELTIPGIEVQPIETSRKDPSDMEVKAIYLTGGTAGSVVGMRMVEHWRQVGGNAVVFDIKDSDGTTSIPFDHPLAPHNHHAIENLPKYVRWLHQHDMHAIARIALFRDEHIAHDFPQYAVQSRAGLTAAAVAPWKENGKLVWTDTSNPDVQAYDISLAKYVAQSGVDEVQFDYVRFPAEGDQKDAKFFFQSAHPNWTRADVIADFLDHAYQQLHPMGVLLSLDVFGVMAWQRDVDLAHTGQDIVRMAHHADVISPMIYPSHFFNMDGYTGRNGHPLPGDAPEHFIATSMERFDKITADSGVVIRPWLQAFGWKTKTYSPQYVMTQVKASKENDGIGFLLWNARNDYSKPYVAMTEMAKSGAYFETASSLMGKRKTRNERVAAAIAAAEAPKLVTASAAGTTRSRPSVTGKHRSARQN